VYAQELHNEYQGTYRGKVIEVVGEESRPVPGTNTQHTYQTIRAVVLDGPQEGNVITIENDYLALDVGDAFYFNHNIGIDGLERYGVISIDRRGVLGGLALAFALLVIILGGMQGVRSLLALSGSFFAIFYVLLPGLLQGWNPLLASVGVASTVLFFAIFLTHGFNRESVVAYVGTMCAVCITGIIALITVHGADLSGFASEESVYLNFNTNGALDFTALLLGAIIIGVLGVLDDIAVTQAAVVAEFLTVTRQ